MKKENVNSIKMKAHNFQLVLNALRHRESLTRKELSGLTGLTLGSITILVNELIERGYVVEQRHGSSTGGRKPVFLSLRPEAAYAVGLELSTNEIICVLGDYNAQVITEVNVRIDAMWGRKTIIQSMVDAIEGVIASGGVDRSKIRGIGLAVPGPADYGNGIMIDPPNFPGWANVHIRDIIREKTGLEVFVAKETSCAALSEYWFGKARDSERIFAMHIGELGIGGAMIDGGEVFASPHGETMNIGHTIVQAGGYMCVCGRRGCLEAQANSWAAMRYALDYANRHPEIESVAKREMDFDDLVRGVEQGDAACLEAVRKCAAYLEVAISNVELLLDPEKIYYRGAFAERCPLLIEEIRKCHEQEATYETTKPVSIEPLTFGKESGPIGALALVYSHISIS